MQAAIWTAKRQLPLFRWAGLGILLLAEMLYLTLRFDTNALDDVHEWWAQALGQSWVVPQLMIAITAASLLFGGKKLWREFRGVFSSQMTRSSTWPYVVAQLLAFHGFTQVTQVILGGYVQHTASPAGWAGLWLVMAMLTGGFWLSAVLSPEIWLAVLRKTWLPLSLGIVLGFAAWFAGRYTSLLWVPMSKMTLWIVHGILYWTLPGVFVNWADCSVGSPEFWVTIAPACSGYEGIGLIWVFLGGYLWFFRQALRFPQALLLFPLGTALIWVVNAVRISLLVLIGHYASPEVAMGGFHSQAGWLALNGVALGLVAVAGRSQFFSHVENVTLAREANPTAAYLAPQLAIVAATMLGASFTHGFDHFYPLRLGLAVAVLWYYRKSYADLKWSFSWPAVLAGAGIFAFWMALEPASTFAVTEDHPLKLALESQPKAWAIFWLVCRVVGSVVTVPIAEELAFRGYLARRLVNSRFEGVPMGAFTWLSFVGSSLVFGLLHGRWFAGTLAGMVFALVLYRRKQLSDAVVAHGVANLLIAGYVLGFNGWGLW